MQPIPIILSQNTCNHSNHSISPFQKHHRSMYDFLCHHKATQCVEMEVVVGQEVIHSAEVCEQRLSSVWAMVGYSY